MVYLRQNLAIMREATFHLYATTSATSSFISVGVASIMLQWRKDSFSCSARRPNDDVFAAAAFFSTASLEASLSDEAKKFCMCLRISLHADLHPCEFTRLRLVCT